MRVLLLTLGLLLGLATQGSAQPLTAGTSPGDSASAVLSAILERGDYRLLDRDTVLDADSRIASDLIVMEATVRVEGRVDGSVAVVRGDLFIRPGASVPGTVAVLGGGVYSSGLAEVGPIVYVDPQVRTSVEGDPRQRQIALDRPVRRRNPLRFPNFFGFGLPTYDRVDGLSLSWSAAIASPGDTAAVTLQGTVGYRTARERLTGGLHFAFRPAYRTLIAADIRRATFTNDAWIRGDLENSLAALLVASDIRDYHESDEASLILARTPPPPLIPGEGFVLPRLTFRASRDRSLQTGNVWAITGDDEWRFNPPIDPGVLASVVAGADAAWEGTSSGFAGQIQIEWAPPDIGDFEFSQLRAGGNWNMLSLYRHEIEVSGFVFLPIGANEAPLQRWSFVGGPGTLPAHPTAGFRGDHLLFVEAAYTAPLPRIQLPVVGPPALRFIYAAGTAWRTGVSMPPLEQNLGAGVQLSIVDLMVYVDPTERPLEPSVSIGATVPLSAAFSF